MPLAIYSQPFDYFTADVVAKKILSIFIKPPENVNKKKELQRQDYDNTKPINFSASLATLKRFTSYNHNCLKRRKKQQKYLQQYLQQYLQNNVVLRISCKDNPLQASQHRHRGPILAAGLCGEGKITCMQVAFESQVVHGQFLPVAEAGACSCTRTPD